jgi:hypothetical protein
MRSITWIGNRAAIESGGAAGKIRYHRISLGGIYDWLTVFAGTGFCRCALHNFTLTSSAGGTIFRNAAVQHRHAEQTQLRVNPLRH